MEDLALAVQKNGANQAVVDSLRNQVILRKIFRHFSSTELLQLSCVTKLWNHEARSVMRERGNVFAMIDKPDLCVQAGALVSALESMNVVFFSAIWINLPDKFAHDDACGGEEVRPICPQSYSGLSSLKYAHMILRGPWWSYQNCPAFQLAKIVLQISSGTLEDLGLRVDLRQEDFIQQVFPQQNCYFPHLKYLSLPELSDEISGSAYANYMRPLVSGAPNLEELNIEKLDPHTGHALEGCTAAVILVEDEVSAPFDDIPEIFMDAVRLEAMELFYTGPGFDFERFDQIAPILLDTSYRTLSTLYICPILLPSLMYYGAWLESVTEFEIDINYSELERTHPRVLGILKNFHFNCTFPNLKTVTVNRGGIVPGLLPDQMNRMLEYVEEAVVMEPQPDRAENIQQLILYDCLFEDDPEFWAHTFPNIRKLCLREDHQYIFSEDFPITSIWKQWADVEELEVSLRDMKGLHPTADSAFCGIFPEECAELRKQDEEFLKSVNIVPAMPAITCFRNLKTFTLDYYTGCFVEELAQPELTKLTRLVSFGRCRPNVAIILKTRWTAVYQALRHMEPYASVVLEEEGTENFSHTQISTG